MNVFVMRLNSRIHVLLTMGDVRKALARLLENSRVTHSEETIADNFFKARYDLIVNLSGSDFDMKVLIEEAQVNAFFDSMMLRAV